MRRMGSRAHGTWARLYADVWGHPKTMALATALEAIGVPRRWSIREAVGQLHQLACGLADTTDDGRIGHLAPRAFCALAGWDDHRRADAVLAAWLSSGFIDDPGTMVARLHGFDEMFGELVRKRAARRAAKVRPTGGQRATVGPHKSETEIKILPTGVIPPPPSGSGDCSFGPDDLARLYLEILPGLPKVRIPLSPKLKADAKKALQSEPHPETWRDRFARAAAGPFLQGRNDRGWRACFAWLLNGNNTAKVDSGAYDVAGNLQTRPAFQSKTDRQVSAFSEAFGGGHLQVEPDDSIPLIGGNP